MKIASPKSIPKGIIHFIKYHNAFVIGFLLIFLMGASVFAASPQARDAVIGKEVTKKGIDNTALLNVNFSDFKQNLKIESVNQTDKKYILKYSYNSFAVKNHRWQKVKKQGKLEVHKKALGTTDLGVYAADELSEVAQADLSRLKKVKKKQQKKGIVHAKQTTKYEGLAGMVLNSETKELSGYKPVEEDTRRVVQTNPKSGQQNNIQQNQNKNATPTDKQASKQKPQKTIEMVDQTTNQLYCIWLEEGSWKKKQGSCDTTLVQADTSDSETSGDSPGSGSSDSSGSNSGTNADNDANEGSATPTLSVYYYDGDDDTFGTTSTTTQATNTPAGYADNANDCNDSDASINPDASEICDDGIDNDCDGKIDQEDSECQTDPTVTLQDNYSGKVGEQITFTAETANFADTDKTYTWDFGNGVTSATTTNSASNVYNATGTYTLTVTVSTASSTVSDSASVGITNTTCSAENLTACDTETKCTDANLYWYDNSCHTEQQNSAPTVQDISATTTTSTPVSITLKGNDEDGDNLTYQLTSQPASGSVTLDASEATYTPNDGYVGSDSFSYVASDDKATSSAATVSVTIQQPADTEPPVISLNGDQTMNLSVDDDYEEPGATATDNRDSSVDVQIDNSEVDTSATGTYAVSYTAVDNAGNEATKERTVNVGN